jgi:cytochrome c biogenesis protein CcmG, thiol:disulfide interchange protein DsbE
MSAASRRGWIVVTLVASLVGVGAWALVRYAPPPEGAQVGRRIPEYRLRQLATGDSIGIRIAYAGHVTLVNIWATWCHPCLREMPSLERLYHVYGSRGFRVAAVSIDAADPAPVLDYVRRLGLSFDILHDKSGAIQQAYQTIGVPTTFLIDKQGRISYIAIGAKNWDSPENLKRVDRLLAGAH